jgi:thiosulfate dehydrogenase (quinone) large subunit
LKLNFSDSQSFKNLLLLFCYLISIFGRQEKSLIKFENTLHLFLLLILLNFMKDTKTFTSIQLITLVTLRLLIGWHILYEGISKLQTPNWSSIGFLKESKWILSGFSNWIISNDGILRLVDFLNTWGLIAIGIGLILGLFTRAAAISGALLLFIYYLNNPPLIGLDYSVPMEGSYLIVSKTLIEAAALVVLAVFPTGSVAGLDMIVSRFKKSNT